MCRNFRNITHIRGSEVRTRDLNSVKTHTLSCASIGREKPDIPLVNFSPRDFEDQTVVKSKRRDGRAEDGDISCEMRQEEYLFNRATRARGNI